MASLFSRTEPTDRTPEIKLKTPPREAKNNASDLLLGAVGRFIDVGLSYNQFASTQNVVTS